MADVIGTKDTTASGSTPATLLTFLIADVRGYTRFTAEHGDEAAARLADRFATLCEAVIGQHEGRVIELRGDEALCVFSSARHALRGAVALQAVFRQSVADDPSLPLTVGMGLDAGEAIPVRGGYRGGALNLAARLCSIAGGGDILASEGVIHLARKTEGLTFVDRGQVTLKGMASPVRVLQIAPAGELPEELPPLQPILVTHPTNLPDDPTPFIGREGEISAVVALLQQPTVRLVTLTGPGGTGKTRLALQVGNALLYAFRDGVFFCDLAALIDSSLVPSAIARVLGVKEEGGAELLATVTERLHEQHLLLVLDNFEHLLDAGTVVSHLLDACRELHILATSRIPLHLSREHEYPVPALSVPDLDHLPSLETLSQYEAVALFIERARAVKPTFLVTNENAPAVAEICARLDGLPLAIELAAARVRVFPPQALLPRLSSRLTLLTGGARDRPTRQQTLRGAIDWSYSMLDEAEKALFARLSVFAGGCTLEAAEAVCDAEGDLEIDVDVLDGVSSLVEKNLLRQEEGIDGEPRFLMLETIKEFAVECLEQRTERAQIRDVHFDYFFRFAEIARSELEGPQQAKYLHLLESEHDNLRAALRWAFQSERPDRAAQLARLLNWFWYLHAHVTEGRAWLEEALRLPQLDPALRALLLRGAAGRAMEQADYAAASAYAEETQVIFRSLGDERGQAHSLTLLAGIAFDQGFFERAVALEEESLAIEQRFGEPAGIGCSLNNLGVYLYHAGDLERAGQLLQQASVLAEQIDDLGLMSAALIHLGVIDLDQDRPGEGLALLRRSLAVQQSAGVEYHLAETLECTAAAFGCLGDVFRSARLYGASEQLRRRLSTPRSATLDERHHRRLEGIRGTVEPSAWNAAWRAGEAMTLEQAVTDALRDATEA